MQVWMIFKFDKAFLDWQCSVRSAQPPPNSPKEQAAVRCRKFGKAGVRTIKLAISVLTS